MIRALLWKEWREWWWVLLGSVVVWVGLVGMWHRYWTGMDSVFEVLFFPAHILPAFIAAKVVAGERNGRTDRFLGALPLRAYRINALKVAIGAAVLVIPLIAAILFAASFPVRYSPLGIPMPMDPLESVLFLSSPLTVYLWTVMLGTGMRSRGGITVIGAAVVFIGIAGSVSYDLELTTLKIVVSSILPTYVPRAIGQRPQLEYIFVGRAITTTILMILAISLPRADRKVGRTHALAIGLGKPPRRAYIRSSISVMIWKSFCEIRWLVLWAVVIDLMTSALVAMIVGRPLDPEIRLQATLQLSILMWILVGSILTIALGVRLMCADRQISMETFWESRPIGGMLMFWVKYLTGALIPLVFVAISLFRPNLNYSGNDGFILMTAAIHLATFNFTILVGSFVRSGFVVSCLASSFLVLIFTALLWQQWLGSLAPLSMALPIVASLKWGSWRLRKKRREVPKVTVAA